MDWTSFPIYNAGNYGYIRASQLANTPAITKARIDLRYNLSMAHGDLAYLKSRVSNAGMRFLQPGFASPDSGTRELVRNSLNAVAFTGFTTGILEAFYRFAPPDMSKSNLDIGKLMMLSGSSLVLSLMGGAGVGGKNESFDDLVEKSSEDRDFAKSHYLCDSSEVGNARRIIGCAEILRDAEWDDLNLAIELGANTIYGLSAVHDKHLNSLGIKVHDIFDEMDPLDPYKSIVGSMWNAIKERLLLRDGSQHLGREM